MRNIRKKSLRCFKLQVVKKDILHFYIQRFLLSFFCSAVGDENKVKNQLKFCWIKTCSCYGTHQNISPFTIHDCSSEEFNICHVSSSSWAHLFFLQQSVQTVKQFIMIIMWAENVDKIFWKLRLIIIVLQPKYAGNLIMQYTTVLGNYVSWGMVTRILVSKSGKGMLL